MRRAAILFGAVQKLWEPIGKPLSDTKILLNWNRQCEDRCRSAIGHQAFEDLQREGARLSKNELIAYALGEKKPVTIQAAPEPDARSSLTKRENEVAELVARGMSNKEIAANLVIAQRTAEGHIEHILVKLGFNSRAQIAAWITGHEKTDGR